MDVTYNDLYMITSGYIHSEKDQKLIRKAFEMANYLHQGQYRTSGEPYIVHPLSVAIILAELHVGPATICAGLLHDTVEDTGVTLQTITDEFGADIALLVDGVIVIILPILLELFCWVFAFEASLNIAQATGVNKAVGLMSILKDALTLLISTIVILTAVFIVSVGVCIAVRGSAV